MKSINFEFIRSFRAELSDLAGFAENYVYADPEGALIKLRLYGENIVTGIFSDLGLPVNPQMNFIEMLKDPQLKSIVPKVVQDKLHLLRKQGNFAAHGGKVKAASAMFILQEAFDLAKWLFLTFYHGQHDQCPQFQQPSPPDSYTSRDYEQLRKEREQLRTKLLDQVAKMAKLLEDIEQVRASASKKKEKPNVEQMLEAGRGAANALKFNEETTRKLLIDTALAEVGWLVGPEKESTEQVGKEVFLLDQPTPSETGYADYVLYADDGRPLAVIEAKKTSKSEEIGRKAAWDYANSLEKQYQHRPIIFYTNGFKTKIWNDAAGEVPREVYGFYSKDSLMYLTQQRGKVKHLETFPINPVIIDRDYQIEAVKRVCRTFENKRRKALMVLATGTGKTRVAIALIDLLFQSGWARNVLFLCDRRELRKQAKNAFTEFTKSPVTIVNANSSRDKDSRIYLSTYPGMMKWFERFDVGFFDVVIADESHRSIYNRYRELFQYFDALQIGLTATPVNKINKNTYELFDCEDQDPTAHYSYSEAIAEGHLVPFEVQVVTTQFLRNGIKYAQMTKEQQQEADEDGDGSLIDYDATEVDRNVMNKDTNRVILRNLMENGITDSSGALPGKSIIFARNHIHALIIQSVFEKMYPQYGGDFCRVIDHEEPRAEQMIDDFKGKGFTVEDARNKPRIAISVDMLDTGVDVPEIVNLVFAKPIKSFVKFWQMIGRGTRLCKNLFGNCKDKKKFLIFDHWQNFEWFDVHYRERQDSRQKSLLQKLFESRIELAEEALRCSDRATFELVIKLIQEDVNDLPEKTIAVRDKYKEVYSIRNEDILTRFDANVRTLLINEIAALMQWRNIRGEVPAYRFDLLTTRLQIESLRNSPRVEDLKTEVQTLAAQLPVQINIVGDKATSIQEVRGEQWWLNLNICKIEELRLGLRGIIHFAEDRKRHRLPPTELDIHEDLSQINRHVYTPRLEGLDLHAYSVRVRQALEALFDSDPVLVKIRKGEPVNDTEIDSLCSLVLTQHPDVNLRVLKQFYPETFDIQHAIKRVIGLDAVAVEEKFSAFVKKHHARMGVKQLHFLRLLKNHLCKYGDIEIDQLYESPFTTVDSEGIDGVFEEEEQIQDLLDILVTFQPKKEPIGVLN